MTDRVKKARQIRKLLEFSTANLTDEQAVEVPAAFPRWDAAGSYEAGDRAEYGGLLYKCLQSHTAQEDWTPEAAPSLWARVLVPDQGEIPLWEQPDSTNGYAKGDRVVYDGKTWESEVDQNVWVPGEYGWIELK